MAEASERDRRYRNRILVIIAAVFFSYLGFKAWHIVISLQAYETQQIDADQPGAAK